MLTALRQTLTRHALAALILPTADPHLSEYIPEHWQARQYFSGFTGSAGVLVVQPENAELWADSRYWTQAEAELGRQRHRVAKARKWAQPYRPPRANAA